MLDSEGYNDAIESYVYMQQKRSDVDPSEKEKLVVEHYRTQTALESLKIESHLPIPSKLPHINEIIFPNINHQPDNTTATSLIGMPNSGKTRTINTIIENREYEIPTKVDEAYGEEKSKLDKLGNHDFETLLQNVLLKQYPDYQHAVFTSRDLYLTGLNSESLALFDRLSWTDLPMIRTHFLLGNIRSGVLNTFENLFLNYFAVKNEWTDNVVISALITPELAMKRQDSSESRGRIMNPPFLYVLYEQYIRFHYEMLNFEKVYKREKDFTYCAVDMSSKNNYERFRSLEKVINWTHIGLSGMFTTESINEVIKKSF